MIHECVREREREITNRLNLFQGRICSSGCSGVVVANPDSFWWFPPHHQSHWICSLSSFGRDLGQIRCCSGRCRSPEGFVAASPPTGCGVGRLVDLVLRFSGRNVGSFLLNSFICSQLLSCHRRKSRLGREMCALPASRSGVDPRNSPNKSKNPREVTEGKRWRLSAGTEVLSGPPGGFLGCSKVRE